MEELPLGRIAALVPEFAVKNLPLGRTLMMMMMTINSSSKKCINKHYFNIDKTGLSVAP